MHKHLNVIKIVYYTNTLSNCIFENVTSQGNSESNSMLIKQFENNVYVLQNAT